MVAKLSVAADGAVRWRWGRPHRYVPRRRRKTFALTMRVAMAKPKRPGA